MKSANKAAEPYQDVTSFPDRVDTVLLRDFLLRTCIPFETTLIGYGTLEKILYVAVTRFGETARPSVRSALDSLAKDGFIVAGPHRDSWRLAR